MYLKKNNLSTVYIAFTSWQALVSEFKLDWNYEPRVHKCHVHCSIFKA